MNLICALAGHSDMVHIDRDETPPRMGVICFRCGRITAGITTGPPPMKVTQLKETSPCTPSLSLLLR